MSETIISIVNLAQYVGQTVTVRGWVYSRTDKGRLQFIQMRDGSGIAQCVAFKKDLPPEEFDVAGKLTQESSLIVTGEVRADERAPGIPGGFEIGIKSLTLVQMADEYPISLKEHGVEFLMDNRHLWLRSSRQNAILKVRATMLCTTCSTKSSARSMSPARSRNATSGSTIQNSIRWRRVFDFSARKVGPNT